VLARQVDQLRSERHGLDRRRQGSAGQGICAPGEVAQAVSGALDHLGGPSRGPVDEFVLARPEGKDEVGDQGHGEDRGAADPSDPQLGGRVPSLGGVVPEHRARLGVTAYPQFA
jgi:hypothetical protein